MSYNTPKIINVFYKEDRKPYDVNGKAISYFGEDFIGANDATKIRFYFLPNQALSGLTALVHAKRADGELRFEILSTTSSDDLGNYFELPLNAWFTSKVGKVTLSLKVYSGEPTYGLTEGVITSIESVAGLTIIASDIFSFNVGYAPNATEVVPPFDDGEFEQLLVALGDKPDFGETIYVVSALPTLTGGVFDNQWFLVKGTSGNIGKLFHINGSTAEEVELGVEQLNLTPSGNGDVVSGDVKGQVKWNADLGTISFGLYDDIEIGAGDTLFWFVKAQSNIAKGDVVQFAGNVGGEVLVKKAVFAEITAQPDLLMGVAKHAIVAGNKGYIISAGRLNNINTSGFTTPILYLSTTTAGLLTSTKPTSGFKGSISAVGRFSTGGGNNGFLLVRPNLIKGVGELTDVTLTSATNGDVLRLQSGVWVNSNTLTTAEDEIDSLDGRLIVAEGEIITLKNEVDQLQTDVVDLDERLDFIEVNGGIDYLKVADFASLPSSGEARERRLFLTEDTQKLYNYSTSNGWEEVRQDKLTADSGEEDGLVEVVFGTTISHSGTSDATALQVIQTSTVGEGNIIEALNSSGIQFQVAKDGTVNAYGDLTIAGNLTVSGTTTTVNTATLDVEDNIITINKNQTGTPETTLLSGIEVERGDQTNFQFVFQESSDLFKVGQVGDLQAVATREDSPTDKGVAIFNTFTNKFETSDNLKVNVNGQLEDVTIRNSAVGVSPLIVNSVASTTANLQEWKFNGSNRAFIENGGMIRTNEGVQNLTSGNNSRVLFSNEGSVISRNVADGNNALRVNLVNASSTGNIADFVFNDIQRLRINRFGSLQGNVFENISGGDNSSVRVNTTGTLIQRNIADALPSLIVNQVNASSTGNIANFQFAGANKLEVTKDGFLTQGGNRLFSQVGGDTNTFFGIFSGGTSTSGVDNTAVGRNTLAFVSSGFSNTAVGRSALNSTTSGNSNVAIGFNSLLVNSSGNFNTAVGRASLSANTTGNGNTGVGINAGLTITTGGQNTFVGINAGATGQLATAVNSTALGQEAFTDKSNQMVFGNASVTEFKFDRNASAILLAPRITSFSTANLGVPQFFAENTNANSEVSFGTKNDGGIFTVLGSYGSTKSSYGITGANDSFLYSNGIELNIVSDNSNGTIKFGTGGSGSTERMRITSTGNVGIGTTTPITTLTLVTQANNDGLQIRRNSVTSNDYASLNFRTSTADDVTNHGAIRAIRTNRAVGQDTDISFLTFSNSTLAERMRIRDDGNVGIGTTIPDKKLEVRTPLGTEASFRLRQSEQNFWDFIIPATNDVLTIRDVGGEKFRITSAGNVGIGTTNPTERLQIGTNFQVTSTGVTLWGNNSENGALTWDTGKAIIGGRVGNALDIRTNNTVKMHITTGGNVGIGTTAPVALLQVATPDVNSYQRAMKIGLGSSNDTAGHFIEFPSSSQATDNLGSRVGGGREGAGGASYIRFDTTNSSSVVGEKMRIRANGNVGIGTTTPDSRLHLQGPVDVSSVITLDLNDSGLSINANQEYGAINWKGNDAQGNGVRADIRVFGEGASGETYMTFGTRTGGNTELPITANERMRITATGNVGVGTASPSVRFEVNGIAKVDGAPSNTQTANYTLVLADKGRVIRINSASNLTLTIPLNSSVAFPIDTEIAVLRYGTGTVSISPTSGVTLNSKNAERKISGQYGSVALKKIGTDEWVLVGSLEA